MNSDKLIDWETKPEIALRELNRIKNEIEKYKTTNEKHNKYLVLLEKEVEDNTTLETLQEKFEARHKLWYNLDRFKKQKYEWLHNDFSTLNTQQIGKDMKQYDFDLRVL